MVADTLGHGTKWRNIAKHPIADFVAPEQLFDWLARRGAEVELHVPALIPEDYLPDVHTRLTLYKRISSARDGEALVERALREVLAGTTALVVAHRPSTVLLADRVALLDGGRIAALGTHSELLAAHPAYRDLLAQESDLAEVLP